MRQKPCKGQHATRDGPQRTSNMRFGVHGCAMARQSIAHCGSELFNGESSFGLLPARGVGVPLAAAAAPCAAAAGGSGAGGDV